MDLDRKNFDVLFSAFIKTKTKNDVYIPKFNLTIEQLRKLESSFDFTNIVPIAINRKRDLLRKKGQTYYLRIIRLTKEMSIILKAAEELFRTFEEEYEDTKATLSSEERPLILDFRKEVASSIKVLNKELLEYLDIGYKLSIEKNCNISNEDDGELG